MAAQICTQCPPTGDLKRLIDGDIADGDQSRLTAHLDACESCQKKIEDIAAGGPGLLACACSTENVRPERTSAYWPAVRELERELVKVSNGPLAVTRGQDEAEITTAVDEDVLKFLDPPEEPGTIGKLGRFHVVELVGKGGMGLVLRALDVCLQRQVALKVLDPQYAKNDLARNRFIREARAAASISHENVVAVHHVEKHRDEFPYLVMRLITGQSLQDLLDEKNGPLEVSEIVRIGQQTAAGLAAAHEQTLIHRDIKPANILLESGTGKVLLTDFGLARATEDAKLTQTGFVAGTPLYMSPEQARGDTLDHRSDLFSLGSVLYAMSTGSPPFQGSSAFVVLRAVTEGRHKPVREINPKVPVELASIIDHLLAKKPEERIQSAAEVAERLSHLSTTPLGMPVVRRSTNGLPRLSRGWWGRNARWVAITLLAFNGLLLLSELTKLTALTVIGQRQRNPQVVTLADEGQKPLLTLDAGTGPIWSVAYSPDGETVATAIDDGSVRLWNAHTGQLRGRITAHQSPVWNLAYNHDGSLLATAGDDGLVMLWDTKSNREHDRHDLKTPIRSLAFSPDGKHLATGTRSGEVRVWDINTWKPITTTGHTGVVMSLAFSPDGKLLASGGGDMMVNIWEIQDGEARERAKFAGHKGGVYAVAFHPEENKVASGSWDRTIRLWDLDTGMEARRYEGHKEDIWSVTFCSRGLFLASGSEDRSAKIWDTSTGKELRTLKGHVGTIYSIDISPDSKTIVTGSRDGTAKIWKLKD